MKKINSLIPVVVSLVVSGCSSSSDPTPETNTTTKPIQCENNQTNINGKCVDNNTTVTPPTCSAGQHLENNVCVNDTTPETNCSTGQHKDSNGDCVKDEDPTLAKINGTVFDGIVSGATMSSCEIVNDIKVEANSTCTSSKIDGTFSCEYKALNGNTLIVKAVGGKDLGADDIVSNDDKTNTYTLKTVFEKSNDINNTKVFATPLSTLVVQKMADSNWAKPLTDAENEVKIAINALNEDIFADNSNVRKLAGIIANIWDTSSDLNLSKFASETLILDTNNKVVDGIISKYNPKINSSAEAVIKDQIERIANSDERNATIGREKTLDLLVDRAENNLSVTNNLASNFVSVINNKYATTQETLDFVAKITDVNRSVENIVDVATKIEDILVGATDKAKEILNEIIDDSTKSLTDLNVSIINEEILKRTDCPTGKVKDVDGMTCIDKPIVLKDAVNSPECIPALPSDDVKVINDGTFPSIPSQNDYNSSYETDFNNSYETTYPNYTCVGEANITTAPWEANATIIQQTTTKNPA